MAAITDPGSAMAAITYPAGSVIDGIGYRVTVQLISWPTTVIDVMTFSKLEQLFLNFMIQMSSKLFFQSYCPVLLGSPH